MFVIAVGCIVKQTYEFPFIIINGGTVGKSIGHLGGVRKVGEDVSLVHGLTLQEQGRIERPSKVWSDFFGIPSRSKMVG